MALLHWVATQVVMAGLHNRRWMSWNLFLAALPAVMAVVLFRPRIRHTAVWWLGVAAFALFLPNAPYVVTDLVHLRHSMAAASSDRAVLAGVLPVYGTFIALGFLCYTVCVHSLLAEARRSRPGWNPIVVAGAVHLVSAIGVLLGRVARLNSWDTVTTPFGTLDRSINTLSWRGAPTAIVVLFVVITVGYAVTSTIVHGVRSVVQRVRTWSDHGGMPAVPFT